MQGKLKLGKKRAWSVRGRGRKKNEGKRGVFMGESKEKNPQHPK